MVGVLRLRFDLDYFFSQFRIGGVVAWRFHYLRVLFVFSVILALSAVLSGFFSARQPATVALDVGLSVIRLLLPLLIVLQMQELICREFDRKLYLSSFSYPGSRAAWLLGRFSVILIYSWLSLAVFAVLLSATVHWVGSGYAQATPVALGWPLVVVVFFQMLELLVIGAAALLLSVVASTPSFVLLGTFGFMIMARSFSSVISLLYFSPWVVGAENNADQYQQGLGVLSYLMPDLGALDVRQVALYGRFDFLPMDVHWLVISALVYSGFFVLMACFLVNSKRLN